MAESVTYKNIFTTFWNNIYDLIKTINDPENRGTKWVYDAYPDSRFDDKTAYPMIIIMPPDISGQDKHTFGTSPQKENTIPIQIDIFTLKAIQIDELMDDIYKKFEDSEGTLFTHNMVNMKILRTNYSNYKRGGMKVHFKSIVYGFKFNYSV